MNSSNWIRWGSLAAMLGGEVFATDTVLTLTVADPSKDRWLDILFVVGILLVVVGLMGFHELQRERYGRIGRAGFYTVVVASLIQGVGLVARPSAPPDAYAELTLPQARHYVLDAGVVFEAVHGEVLAMTRVLEAAVGHLGD